MPEPSWSFHTLRLPPGNQGAFKRYEYRHPGRPLAFRQYEYNTRAVQGHSNATNADFQAVRGRQPRGGGGLGVFK